ncbi:MAG: hypothetical protein NTX53_06060 [candidate division WOR-3 bacterium]|nr:hypothetical protein [candidate division WOR-3 bacterium]
MLSWWCAFGLVSKFVVLAWIAVLTIAVLSSRTAIRRLTSSLKAIFIGQSPTVLFFVTYTIMLLVTSSTTAYDPIDDRLLSPVYVAATLVLLKLVSDLLSPTQLPSAAFVRKVPAVLLALWLCLPLTSVAQLTRSCLRNGAGGYNTKTWRESGTVAYAKQVLSTNDDVHVHSNGQDVLWALAGMNAASTPSKTYYRSTKSANQLGDLVGRWPPEGEAYLVWFKNRIRPYSFSVEELEEVANIVEVARLSDGSIYHISVREAAVQDSSHQVGGAPSVGGTTTLESPSDESR